jgi:isopentenyldiphosphate isomerase
MLLDFPIILILNAFFTGTYEWLVNLNADEVDSFKLVNIDDLRADIEKNSENYAPWFKIIFEKTTYFGK